MERPELFGRSSFLVQPVSCNFRNRGYLPCVTSTRERAVGCWSQDSARELSIVVKVIGLYFVAAVILFFVFYEQSPAAGREQNDGALKQRSPLPE